MGCGRRCPDCGFQYLTEWTDDVTIAVPPEWWDHDIPFPTIEFPVRIALCTACGVLTETVLR